MAVEACKYINAGSTKDSRERLLDFYDTVALVEDHDDIDIDDFQLLSKSSARRRSAISRRPRQPSSRSDPSRRRRSQAGRPRVMRMTLLLRRCQRVPLVKCLRQVEAAMAAMAAEGSVQVVVVLVA
jgi:hypothetical protein